MIKKISIFLLLVGLPISANAKSAEEDRQEIREMRSEVLAQLYQNNPEAKDLIAGAEGYAVFNNGGVNLILLSAGSGKGVAHDNKSGKDVFMRMATGGVGIGLGIKDYRAVIVFHKRAMFDQFVDKGWDFSGQADAAAKIDDTGGEANAADSVVSGVTVYQMTKKGLALQATLQGTKYWKVDKWNN
ncbi:MAG TPA: YSC84-related protein [Emcibacteraceae bacterium]|nr:YSC84-related protein [Emcibacteraceae bacterium]HRW31162.1 YSC84-related protein [Emcibacteraceae bacterium]